MACRISDRPLRSRGRAAARSTSAGERAGSCRHRSLIFISPSERCLMWRHGWGFADRRRGDATPRRSARSAARSSSAPRRPLVPDARPRLEAQRRGDWLQTFTGRQFWPLDPEAEDVDLEDIAHALAHLCRFGGHTRVFYSVAEHCVRVSLACDSDDALAGLLHDAAEAYIVDVPRPLKRHLIGYKDAEAAVHAVIAARFNIGASMPASVEAADLALLSTEARDLMARPPNAWSPMPPPLPAPIVPWGILEARSAFLQRFAELAR